MIKIHQGKITEVEDKAIMSTDIEIDGKIKTVHVSVDKVYGNFLSPERADYALVGMLRYALAKSHDITCEVPVTDELLYNIREIYIPTLKRSDDKNYSVKIFAKTAPPLEKLNFAETEYKNFYIAKNDFGNFKVLQDTPPHFGAIGTGFSCGVDSFYTVLKHLNGNYPSMNLTHVAVFNIGSINGIYGKENIPRVKTEVWSRAEKVAAELNLPLDKLDSDFQSVIPQSHLLSHTYMDALAIYSLQKLWSKYYYSGAYAFNEFSLTDNLSQDPAHFELLLLDCFSTSKLKIIPTGSEGTRKDKTEFIANFPVAQKNLHVCIRKGDHNCGVCAKCVRTLFDLDALNKLDDFKEVFDVDDYRKNVRDRYRYLYRTHVIKKNLFLKEAYEVLSERHKDLFKIAAAEVEAEQEKKKNN